MRILKILLPLIGCVFFVNSYSQTNAKSPDFFAASWEISFPTNNNYLTKTSFAGGRVEYRRKVAEQISVGLGISWNSFEEYFPYQTYVSQGGSHAVTTDMIRQIYTVPMTALFHYYPKLNSKLVQPYVGIGLGAEYAEQYAYFNIYEESTYNWGFVARPEIGATVNLGPSVKGLLSLSYNYATNHNDAFDIDHLNQFGINVGIGWGF